jgi:serine protease Do
VTPLFLVHGDIPEIIGLGTSFFINSSGVQLTAMHLLTDMVNGRVGGTTPFAGGVNMNGARLGILHDPGLFYGRRPAGTFLAVHRMDVFPRNRSQDPLRFTLSDRALHEIEPGIDLAFLSLTNGNPGTPFRALGLDVGNNSAVVPGARVMAVGYPEIDGQTARATPNGFMLPYRESMCGSIATVVSVHETTGPGHSRWPTIVVDQDWPPGMSGGPIFNEHGGVVGIVSRGGPGFSCGVWIQKAPQFAVSA